MIALMLGCAPEDPTAPDIDPPDPVPWVLPATGDEEPVEIAAVVQAASDAIELLAGIEPDPVLDAYRDLASGADPNCPALYLDNDLEYWLDSCTSGDGTRFDGFGIDDELIVDDGYDGVHVSATGGTGRIEGPDGDWLEYDGFAQRIDDDQGGVVSSTLVLSGSFDTNHPAADGTWVGEGLRPNLTMTTYEIGGDRAAFAVTGAIDGLPGEFPSVAFDENGMIDPAFGYGGCGLEPSGVLSVRLSSGEWVDVVFDPVAADDGGILVDDPALCDGCGAAWHRAEQLGEMCLDFSSWLR